MRLTNGAQLVVKKSACGKGINGSAGGRGMASKVEAQEIVSVGELLLFTSSIIKYSLSFRISLIKSLLLLRKLLSFSSPKFASNMLRFRLLGLSME